jgi:hypothetical protein
MLALATPKNKSQTSIPAAALSSQRGFPGNAAGASCLLILGGKLFSYGSYTRTIWHLAATVNKDSNI